MGNICIIPARGGSKRIPKKNIKSFLGKPIISYSIKAAIECELFEDIIVSTDNLEIAKVAKDYGASVPFMRSKKNSDDFATTYDVLEEVIENLSNIKLIYDNLCCLYPCAPFVKSKILKRSYYKMIKNNYDSLFPVIPYSFPIQRALNFKNGLLKMNEEINLNVRSQDLEKMYHDVGQFYWCQINKLLKNKQILSDNTGGIIISETEAQDIDSETDWKLAEMKFKITK